MLWRNYNKGIGKPEIREVSTDRKCYNQAKWWHFCEICWKSESFKTYPSSYILEEDQVKETIQDHSFRFSEFSTPTAHTRSQITSATRKEKDEETYTDNVNEHDKHEGLGPEISHTYLFMARQSMSLMDTFENDNEAQTTNDYGVQLNLLTLRNML